MEAEGKPEKQLNAVGVAVRDQSGNFRNFSNILDDLNGKWGTLSQTEKIATAQQVAGIQRYNDFISLMNNYQMAVDSTTTALNSQGSATKENEIYMQSAQAKIEQFKTGWQEVALNLIDSQSFKDLVDVGTSLTGVFSGMISNIGGFNTIMLGVVGTLTIFNKSFRDNMSVYTSAIPKINSLKTSFENFSEKLKHNADITNQNITSAKEYIAVQQSQGKSTVMASTALGKMQTSLALTKAGLIATKVATIALDTAMSMGLSLAISLAIEGIGKLGTALFGTGKTMADCQEQIDGISQSLDNMDSEKELSVKYIDDSKELANTTNLTKRKELEASIKESREQLVQIDSSYKDILDNQNLSLDQQFAKMDEIAKKKVRDSLKEWDKSDNTPKQSDMEKLAEKSEGWSLGADGSKRSYNKDSIDYQIEKYKELKQVIQDIQTNGEGKYNNYTYTSDNMNELTSKLADFKTQILSGASDLDLWNQQIKNCGDYNVYTAKTHIGLSDSTHEFINKLQTETEQLKENSKEQDENNKLKEDAIDVKAQAKDYADSLDKMGQIYEIQNKINKEGSLTPEIIQSALGLYPEMGASVFDVATLQEYLNKKIKEQEDIQRQAYLNMMQDDESFFNTKIKNTTSWQEFEENVLNALGQVNQNYYSGNIEGMKNELENAKTLAQARYSVEAKCVEAIANIWAEYYSKMTFELDGQTYNKYYSDGKGGYYDTYNKETGELETPNKYAKETLEQLERVRKMQEAMKNLGSDISFQAPTFTGASFDKGSSAKKEIEDIESLVDRYYKLNNVLNDINQSISTYDTLQKNVTGAKNVEYIQKEISLYKQKQKAISDMIAEMKSERYDEMRKLENAGFTFDSAGNVANYAKQLEYLTNVANSKSGDAKKQAQENVKAMLESLSKYADLTFKSIPQMAEEWEKLSKSVKDTYSEMNKIVIDREKDIYNTIKYYAEKTTETRKKEIDKQITEINKKYDEEQDQIDIDKQTKKLADLKAEMDKYENSIDRKAQVKFKQLKEQYEEMLEELNRTIAEKQHNATIDALNNQKDKLDEALEETLDPSNLNKLIAQALQTGYVSMGDSLVSITDLTKNMLKETEVGWQNTNTQIKESIDNLTTVQELYKNMASINSNLGVSNYGTANIPNGSFVTLPKVSSNINNSSNSFAVNITVNGNADNATVNDINRIITSKLKEYDDKMKR